MVTVGLSPLPILLAVVHLRPVSVTPIVTAVSRTYWTRIGHLIETLTPGLRREEPIQVDPASALHFEQRLQGRLRATDLAYVGGTNLMVAQVYRNWLRQNDNDSRCSWYCAAEAGELRCTETGVAVSVDAPYDGCLGLGDLVALHQPENANWSIGPSTHRQDEWKHHFVTEYVDEHSRALSKYRFPARVNGADQHNGRRLQEEFEKFPRNARPPAGQDIGLGDRTGLGFEAFALWATRQALVGETDIHIDHSVTVLDTEGQRSFDLMELDIVVQRKHRVAVISVTANGDDLKVFQRIPEVAMKARRIGGDFTSTAVVCTRNRAWTNRHVARTDHTGFASKTRLFSPQHMVDDLEPAGVDNPVRTSEFGIWLRNALGLAT